MPSRKGGFIIFDDGTKKPIPKLTQEEITPEIQELIDLKIIK